MLGRMTDRWDFYLCHVEDRAASIAFDEGLFADTPQAARPWLLTVRVPLRSPREDGLPDGSENDVLGPWEDQLEAALADRCDAVYVGRLQTNGARELFFYAPDPGAFESAVDAFAPAPFGYEVDLASDEDPGWRQYREFLFPGPVERRWIQDRHVVDALEEHGDLLDVARPVDHWLYFPDAAQRDAFARDAEALGFTCTPGEAEDGRASAQLCRADPVRLGHIHGVTSELTRLAAAHDGEYDGWGTRVQKAPEAGG